MKALLLAAVGLTFGVGFGIFQNGSAPHGPRDVRPDGTPWPVQRSDAEWRKRLTPEQYKILRQGGTEPAFCGKLHLSKDPGIYACVGCENKLFSSDHKFDSGTGWPSFFRTVRRDSLVEVEDRSYGMVRVEILCSQCGGHMGHVFDDAPQTPTGRRYCLNGTVLKFLPRQPK